MAKNIANTDSNFTTSHKTSGQLSAIYKVISSSKGNVVTIKRKLGSIKADMNKMKKAVK